MNRITITAALILLAAGVAWRFPLFHVVPLQQVEAERNAAAFDAAKFAAEFWNNQLAAHLDKADDVGTVLAALRDNPVEAREQFGRQVGVSRTTYYFLRGAGEIVNVDAKSVTVSLNADARLPDILLTTGKVFNNSVRDATGLLLSGDFPNSQDFNALTQELNRLAQAKAIKPLKASAKPGRRVEFVGCAAITADKFDAPLKLIPVDVSLE